MTQGTSGKSRTALVTGAASGIGFECARRLGQAGMTVLMLDRSASVVEAASQLRALDIAASPIELDLADSSILSDRAKSIQSQYGTCDILVNNAGIHPKPNGFVASLDVISLCEWEEVFKVNVTAPFLLAQALIPAMVEGKWGRVVNIASRAGRTYSPRAGTHYSASKSAVLGVSRKLAGDYARFGVTVNCVAPGQIDTALARTSATATLESARKMIPAGRLGLADEIASAVEYLSSDAAAFINGAVIDVNGGEWMG